MSSLVKDILIRLGAILFMVLWANFLAWVVGTTFELGLLYTLLGFVAGNTVDIGRQ